MAKPQKTHPSVEKLLVQLESENWRNRTSACNELGRAGDTRAIASLVPRVDDEDGNVRRAACFALHRLLRARITDRDSLAQYLDEAYDQAQGTARETFCTMCLCRASEVKLRLTLLRTCRYFACPKCGRAAVVGGGEVLAGVKQVVAALDKAMHEPLVARNGTLTANWLACRSLFDFDSVEIVKAREIDVEKFCVQVRNDTHPDRKKRYKSMQCRVRNRLKLRENTLRNLSAAFGEVVRV
jgi:hypothetical protein